MPSYYVQMSKELLITGATKGIGRAILFQFAVNGFNVVTCARSKTDLEKLELEFSSQFPNQTLKCFIADLSRKSERKKFGELVKSFRVDVLVNNAGIFIPGTVLEEEEGKLEQMIETNLYSAYELTRVIAPNMRNFKKGSIFNICSTASVMAYPNGGSYCISKFALLGFSKVLREELKNDGVKVTSVLPGATFTPSWDGVNIPEARFMPPEDVAKCIWDAYKLSDRTVLEELILRPQLGDL